MPDLPNYFKMPRASIISLTALHTVLNHRFASATLPVLWPDKADVDGVLDRLGMTPETIECAYCGGEWTDWDHFLPVIEDGVSTGYFSEIANLVPSCGRCNQSKGKKHWKLWMLSAAKNSPKTRKISDLDARIVRLDKFEAEVPRRRVDVAELAPPELWERYKRNLIAAKELISASAVVAKQIQAAVQEKVEGDTRQ